jgi:predicted transcriptional regulator
VEFPPPVDPAASAAAMRDLLNRLFDGNAEEIVAQLAESNQLSPEELARMKEIFRKEGKPGRK